ncbi:unnamed protein product [Urochloa humidicola]
MQKGTGCFDVCQIMEGGILVLGEQGARLSLHSTHSTTCLLPECQTGSVAGGSSSSLHFPHFPVVGGCCSKNIKDLIMTKRTDWNNTSPIMKT